MHFSNRWGSCSGSKTVVSLASFGHSWKQKTSKSSRILSRYGINVSLYLPYSVLSEKMRRDFLGMVFFLAKYLNQYKYKIDYYHRTWEHHRRPAVGREWYEWETMLHIHEEVVSSRFTFWFFPDLSKCRDVPDEIREHREEWGIEWILCRKPESYREYREEQRSPVEYIESSYFPISKCENRDTDTDDKRHSTLSTSPSPATSNLSKECNSRREYPDSPREDMRFSFPYENTANILDIRVQSNDDGSSWEDLTPIVIQKIHTEIVWILVINSTLVYSSPRSTFHAFLRRFQKDFDFFTSHGTGSFSATPVPSWRDWYQSFISGIQVL